VVTAKVGGLAKFAKKVATCIGCKTVLSKDLGKNIFIYTYLQYFVLKLLAYSTNFSDFHKIRYL